MTIWLPLLLWAVGKLIEWLMTRGRHLTPAEIDKLNKAIYQMNRLERAAVSAGCVAGGTP